MSQAAKPPRFFVLHEEPSPDAVFVAGEEVNLPPSEAHHAAHVLRLKAGDAVELFDGRGTSAGGRIVRVRHGRVTAVAEEVRPPAARPGPLVHLAFAVPKGNRLDWLLEKSTELGVASLRPVTFERSVAGTDELSPAKRTRWLGHVIAAAKQAGLDFLPDLGEPLRLAAYLASAGGGARVYGDLAADALPLAAALQQAGHADRGPASPSRGQGVPAIHIVVGPEGGLAEAERQMLRRAGFTAARLGRTTLRIETAAVALVAAALAVADSPAPAPSS